MQIPLLTSKTAPTNEGIAATVSTDTASLGASRITRQSHVAAAGITVCMLAGTMSFGSLFSASPGNPSSLYTGSLQKTDTVGIDRHWLQCVKDSGSTCFFRGCDEDLGPTRCEWFAWKKRCMCNHSSCAGLDGRCQAVANKVVTASLRLKNAEWPEYYLHLNKWSVGVSKHKPCGSCNDDSLFNLLELPSFDSGSKHEPPLHTRHLFLGSVQHPSFVPIVEEWEECDCSSNGRRRFYRSRYRSSRYSITSSRGYTSRSYSSSGYRSSRYSRSSPYTSSSYISSAYSRSQKTNIQQQPKPVNEAAAIEQRPQTVNEAGATEQQAQTGARRRAAIHRSKLKSKRWSKSRSTRSSRSSRSSKPHHSSSRVKSGRRSRGSGLRRLKSCTCTMESEGRPYRVENMQMDYIVKLGTASWPEPAVTIMSAGEELYWMVPHFSWGLAGVHGDPGPQGYWIPDKPIPGLPRRHIRDHRNHSSHVNSSHNHHNQSHGIHGNGSLG
eukprot:gnl/TRDRNA2_/TRDRNA2_83796_c0_seq1.p1 gnl/TRDRNA2_/TRDRNA2_83796_c0~~gnl/TRDRNA2_/TRDRNA2_83796_c0_seq1.p1  ORF type:complete len:495 (-),score=34.03 gnl/TRDRNA2_/TRDRNA2_83796_c0_seq1:232-1716(-)